MYNTEANNILSQIENILGNESLNDTDSLEIDNLTDDKDTQYESYLADIGLNYCQSRIVRNTPQIQEKYVWYAHYIPDLQLENELH